MNGVIDSAIFNPVTLAPMTSHDQESHVVPHFNCFDLRNAKVLLMMLLTLCDAGANGIT